MLLADILIKDGLRIDGDVSLMYAAQRLASEFCESAPVFLGYQFVGLFIPEECWRQLTRLDCQQQMVKEFISKDYHAFAESTEVNPIILNSNKHLIGVDEDGKYVGHLPKKYLLKEKEKNENNNEQDFLHLIFDSLAVGVVAIDTGGVINFANKTAVDILKVKKSDLTGNTINAIIPKSQLTKAAFESRTQITTVSINDSALVVAHNPIVKNGGVCGAVSVFQDMAKFEGIATELESMKALAAEFKAIFENSYDGIYITDGDGYTLRVNKAYERITGLRRDELLQKNMKDIVAKGMISESLTFKIKKTRTPMTITQKIHGGKEILVSGVPVFNENGELARVITNVRDMTELNNIRTQLEKSRELASLYEKELKELRASQIEDPDFISNSKKMNETLELAFRVAKVDSTVLIQGESGVGKEIIANLIHKYSPRSITGPFIKINCSAIPADLLESELFGYEEGAFTGAKKNGKPGMFELAHNGTLFLDEIGTIPGELQVKLLRVIQFNEIMRLGGVQAQKVNIRLLTATSKNLEDLMNEGKFREDLYYRLKVVPIRVPPLRERKDDIFPLTVYYLDKFNQKYKLSKRFSKEAMDALTLYQWPGNVRELMNLIERLVVTTPKDIIRLDELPSSITGNGKLSNFIQKASGESLKEVLNLVEKEALVRAFKDFKTTRKVGEALKISQSAVMRKVQKHNLQFKRGWDAKNQ